MIRAGGGGVDAGTRRREQEVVNLYTVQRARQHSRPRLKRAFVSGSKNVSKQSENISKQERTRYEEISYDYGGGRWGWDHPRISHDSFQAGLPNFSHITGRAFLP